MSCSVSPLFFPKRLMPPIYLALSLMPMRRVVRSEQYQGADWGGFGWADAGVIIPYQLYMMYGDVSVIHENWELMTRYMDYLSTTDKLGGRPVWAITFPPKTGMPPGWTRLRARCWASPSMRGTH